MMKELYERVRNKLMQRYRVELIDDETMYQSRSYLIRPLSVLLVGVLLFVVIVGSTMALVIYVPVFHRLIPNYIDPAAYKQERAEMATRVLRAEQEIDRLIAYNQNFQRLAGGGNADSIPQFSQRRLDSVREAHPQASSLVQQAALEDQVEPGPAQSTVTVASPINPSGPPAVKAMQRSVLDRLFNPLQGTLRNPYDEGKRHYGVDIVAEQGALIKAAHDGFVLFAEYSEDNGWVISVSAGQDNVVTFYKHNSRLLKEVGSYVRAGEAIAEIGNTGENSTGPHLHFELWQNGKSLDPADFINF